MRRDFQDFIVLENHGIPNISGYADAIKFFSVAHPSSLSGPYFAELSGSAGEMHRGFSCRCGTAPPPQTPLSHSFAWALWPLVCRCALGFGYVAALRRPPATARLLRAGLEERLRGSRAGLRGAEEGLALRSEGQLGFRRHTLPIWPDDSWFVSRIGGTSQATQSVLLRVRSQASAPRKAGRLITAEAHVVAPHFTPPRNPPPWWPPNHGRGE